MSKPVLRRHVTPQHTPNLLRAEMTCRRAQFLLQAGFPLTAFSSSERICAGVCMRTHRVCMRGCRRLHN
eukprot:6206533-Pleurochrysis_carterae.AAC.2